jgi:hypothetical protein
LLLAECIEIEDYNSFQLIRGNDFRAIELVACQPELVGLFDAGLLTLASKFNLAMAVVE